jgi:hypothetical protein
MGIKNMVFHKNGMYCIHNWIKCLNSVTKMCNSVIEIINTKKNLILKPKTTKRKYVSSSPHQNGSRSYSYMILKLGNSKVILSIFTKKNFKIIIPPRSEFFHKCLTNAQKTRNMFCIPR